MVTANGNAQIDTAQSKFGGASGLFDGTGDYLSLADSSDWAFGTENLTIDFWYRLADYTDTAHGALWSQQADGSNINWMAYSKGDQAFYFFSYVGGAVKAYYGFNYNTTDNNWHHLALVRNGEHMYLYLDGTALPKGEATAVGTQSITITGTGLLKIGYNGWNGTAWNGWLDEFRISKGIARWTSNFTSPSAPYTAAPSLTWTY